MNIYEVGAARPSATRDFRPSLSVFPRCEITPFAALSILPRADGSRRKSTIDGINFGPEHRLISRGNLDGNFVAAGMLRGTISRFCSIFPGDGAISGEEVGIDT